MFKFLENLKIREVMYRYRYFKNLNPQLSENQICLFALEYRIKKYYRKYLLINNDEEKIKNLIKETFRSDINLRGACKWIMEQEYKKYSLIYNSSDLAGWKKRIDDLDNRIVHYQKIILGT